MRALLLSIALFVALLGVFALGFVRPPLAVQTAPAHSHLLVDGGATPNAPVCPGGGSTNCGG